MVSAENFSLRFCVRGFWAGRYTRKELSHESRYIFKNGIHKYPRNAGGTRFVTKGQAAMSALTSDLKKKGWRLNYRFLLKLNIVRGRESCCSVV